MGFDSKTASRLVCAVLALGATLAPAARVGAEPLPPGVHPRAGTIRDCERIPAVDVNAYSALLGSGRFAELDRQIGELDRAYRDDPACEGHLWEVFRALAKTGDPQRALLDRWVDASPKSAAAKTVRGAHWTSTGYRRRGAAPAKDTPEERFAAMRKAFALAIADLGAAIRLDSRMFVAYGTMMQVLRAMGKQRQAEALLPRLLEVDPLNYGARRDLIWALDPKWGGSIERMQRVAAGAQPYVHRNARLRVLQGMPYAVIARELENAENHDDAVAAYEKALSFGDYPGWTKSIIDIENKRKNYAGVIVAATRYLETFPDGGIGLVWRAEAYHKSGQSELGIRDMDRAISLYPRWTIALATRGWIHKSMGSYQAAADDFARVLELTDRHYYAEENLAEILGNHLHRYEEAERHWRHVTELWPRYAKAWLGLAKALQRLGLAEEARASSERYLALVDADDPHNAKRIQQARHILDPDPGGSGRTLPGIQKVLSESGGKDQ